MPERLIHSLLRIFLRRRLGIDPRPRRRWRRRGALGWLIYLVIVVIIAVVLWNAVPAHIWNTLYRTYFAAEAPQ